MNRRAIRSFALSLVFLAVAVVFYFKSDVSLARSLAFFFYGVASGCFLVVGINASKTNRRKEAGSY